jgi:hypothetical protein
MANPISKNPTIAAFLQAMMGVDVQQSIREDICVSCHQSAKEFETPLAEKEFTISGLCQKCQDGVFNIMDEDEGEDEETGTVIAEGWMPGGDPVHPDWFEKRKN